jgi:hypothetical protein
METELLSHGPILGGTAILAGGGVLLVRGVLRAWLAGGAALTVLGRVTHLAYALRLVLVGLALVGIGAGWMYGLGWLVGVSVAIGLEELYEVTTAIGALRWAERNGWPDARPLPPVVHPLGRVTLPTTWPFRAGDPVRAS